MENGIEIRNIGKNETPFAVADFRRHGIGYGGELFDEIVHCKLLKVVVQTMAMVLAWYLAIAQKAFWMISLIQGMKRFLLRILKSLQERF